MEERQEPQSWVVIDTSNSPFAKLRPVAVDSVTLKDSFWQPRREVNQTKTIPEQHRQCETTGRLRNFQRLAGKYDGPFEGISFNDSDVYKWAEAAAFAIGGPSGSSNLELLDTVIETIYQAQDGDGYLNTYFSLERSGERWSNLRDMHELYCAGHLFQAAVANYRSTGSKKFLNVASRFADNICAKFGEEGRPGACGHEEIEMAMVELYRATGKSRYLDQAKRFIELRGQKPSAVYNDKSPDNASSPYCQDHVPVRDLREVLGHAVRMMYLDCGAADVYLETGEPALLEALEAQWSNMTQRRMYVTGGLGSRYEGEAFGADYLLPNLRAYTETCAAIGSVMWNARMLAATAEAKYADVLELALYNAVLAGLSLDGGSYFYQNPLQDDGRHRRQPWFGCACCPPNIARLLAQVPSYFYSTSDAAVWVHLYAASEAHIVLPDGKPVGLKVDTDYPWDGAVRIDVNWIGNGTLNLRIPGWCESGYLVSVNSQPIAGASEPGSYIALTREWTLGDIVDIVMPMPVRRIYAHPKVTDDTGRVALARGPLIYCAEQTDNPGIDLLLAVAPAQVQVAHHVDLLNGVTVLTGQCRVLADRSEALYRSSPVARATNPAELKLIPYYAWANREAGGMVVWMVKGDT